jgi:hypothetical protein
MNEKRRMEIYKVKLIIVRISTLIPKKNNSKALTVGIRARKSERIILFQKIARDIDSRYKSFLKTYMNGKYKTKQVNIAGYTNT